MRPHRLLRGLLAAPYTQRRLTRDRAGRFVLPASASVAVVLRLEDSPIRSPQFVHGVRREPTAIEGGCAPSYIEFALTPLGGYILLGAPMNELAGKLVDLSELLGDDAHDLGNAVRAGPTWRHRVNSIERVLLRRRMAGPTVAPEVAYTWRQLVTTGGRTPIRAIREEVGWSHRHFISRFTAVTGLAPKRAARLIRFERVLRATHESALPDWAGVAAAHGYADQAHLIREFGEFAGVSPTTYHRAASCAAT